MSARPLVSLVLLLALMLERFGYYAFRSQFVLIEVGRGLERGEVLELYARMGNLITALAPVVACVAILAPRVWLAPVGALIALGGYLTATLGPQVLVPVGVVIIAMGTATTKVSLACAAADFVDSPRARLVVGLIAYGLVNLGAFAAPFATLDARDDFSKASVVALVVVVVLCGLAAVLSQVLPKPAPAAEPTASGLAGMALLLPVGAFFWLMMESQPFDLDVPKWALSLNAMLTVLLSPMLAVVFGLVPMRALPWLVLAMLAGSLVLTALGAVGLSNRDPSVWVGVQVGLTMAEAGLGMGVFGLMLGSTPPRFAPLTVALMAATGTLATQLVVALPDLRVPVLVVVGLISVAALTVYSVFFRFTLGPLGREEPAAR